MTIRPLRTTKSTIHVGNSFVLCMISASLAGQITAARFIARYRREVRRVVANWTGIYQYTIDQVLEDMIARCRELKLRLAGPEEQARQEFTVLLTVQVMNYLHSGGHRLFL